jgi:hypothetical protein
MVKDDAFWIILKGQSPFMEKDMPAVIVRPDQIFGPGDHLHTRRLRIVFWPAEASLSVQAATRSLSST